MRFEGKTGVVTGAAQGIGLAICELLSAGGANVVISDVNEAAGAKAVEAVAAKGGQAVFVKADVSQKSEIENLFKAAEDKFGGYDLLVNNAGICPVNSYDNISVEEWDRVLGINLRGVFLCSQVAAPMLKKQKGAIVNIASISGRTARNVGAHYAASKAGVITLSRQFALWLAPDVRVNAVAPGPVESEMTRSMPKETLEWISRQSLLGCIGEPMDVAELVCFLLSDAAKHMTGAVVDINAGQFMG